MNENAFTMNIIINSNISLLIARDFVPHFKDVGLVAQVLVIKFVHISIIKADTIKLFKVTISYCSTCVLSKLLIIW